MSSLPGQTPATGQQPVNATGVKQKMPRASIKKSSRDLLKHPMKDTTLNQDMVALDCPNSTKTFGERKNEPHTNWRKYTYGLLLEPTKKEKGRVAYPYKSPYQRDLPKNPGIAKCKTKTRKIELAEYGGCGNPNKIVKKVGYGADEGAERRAEYFYGAVKKMVGSGQAKY